MRESFADKRMFDDSKTLTFCPPVCVEPCFSPLVVVVHVGCFIPVHLDSLYQIPTQRNKAIIFLDGFAIGLAIFRV